MSIKGETSVSFVSLGCFKNLVDTEVLGGMLEKRGISLVSPYENTDWIVINTCGFIRDAKEESIDEIFSALEKKEKGEIKGVAVFGCLSQRYNKELIENFNNVDILWGVNDLDALADLIASGERSKYQDKNLFLYDHNHKRITTTTPNVTFLKISEGCNMKCSFCAIPQIRGPYRSRTIESIVKEASRYKEIGVQEINLISQNSTYFGMDKQKKSQLPKLLTEISKLDITWVRVLYLMPEEVDDQVIEAFSHPSIIPYFDLPFQHVSSPLLKTMKRSGSFSQHMKLIEKIRHRFDEAVIRSSFIVGFPGETKKDFEELLRFASEARIERIGAFAFSPEEDTEAFILKQELDETEIAERKEMLMQVSDENITRYNKDQTNKHHEFLPLAPWQQDTTIGRIKSQAPEIDGFTQMNITFDDHLKIRKVKITGFENELLYGEKV